MGKFLPRPENERISPYHMAFIYRNGTSKPVPYKKRTPTAAHPSIGHH
ncbi:MAG: hypothetical protein IJZ80_04885 [Clostridia bacterium]|nr:hypothetical protein [Clostridia bacterium]